MVWHKEIKDATIKHDVEPPPELSQRAGSVLVIDQLEKAQMNLITGNILAKYLSRACRTVLMKSEVDLVIDDHGSKVIVKPKKYEGTKFPIVKCESIGGFGSISLEIYAFPPVESPDEFRVPVFCKGAKGYDDITEIPELNVYPWNAKKVYGEVNYPFATLSPSRTGFVNDAFLDAFIKAMQGITTQLSEFVSNIEARKKARQRDKFYAIFRETWQEIFKMLPEEWLRPGIGPVPPPPPPPPVEIGQMYRVEISPDGPKVACRTIESFTARPYDINGNIVRDPSLIYYWKLSGKPLGLLKDDVKRTCHFQAGNQEGIATLTVAVLQFIGNAGNEQTIKKTGATNLWVVRELPLKPPPPPPPHGDKPPTLLEDNLGEDGPHSKYEPLTKIVKVNDHHKDYIKAKERSDETLYRYIIHCFAKEIAVDRWKSLDSHELSEKITDLVSISERAFDWKELIKKRKGRRPKEKESD